MEIPSSIRPFVRAARLPWRLLRKSLLLHPYFRFERETANTQTPATVADWLRQNVLLQNEGPYWPVHPSSTVSNWQNVLAGVETSPGLMAGCYVAALAPIYIGDYTQIAANVGLISANHVPEDNREYKLGEIRIGAYCWIGMNVVVLPGVTLGDFTIIGAGAVVTKSFPEGYCVLGGTPAKVIKRLDPSECVRHKSEHEYHGFIPKAEFEQFRRRNLRV